ncbi:MAG: helix-turn-helix domain-containing protein [Pyrinomonadaceae bacterium]|nr:helix-turn-helix domain-containing protein [Pyrinomonadaceae bacterium]
MPRLRESKTTSKRFADLLQSVEQSDRFQIDALKVEISEQIYRAMNRQRISNAELARRLGKSRAYVTKLLRGTTNFTLESLVRIGRALSNEVQISLVSKPTARRKTKRTKKRPQIAARLSPQRKASQAR